jgi:hypothetical protein
MRCLYCGDKISFLKKNLAGGNYCTQAHRKAHLAKQNEQALARLMESKPGPSRRAAVTSPPLAQSWLECPWDAVTAPGHWRSESAIERDGFRTLPAPIQTSIQFRLPRADEPYPADGVKAERTPAAVSKADAKPAHPVTRLQLQSPNELTAPGLRLAAPIAALESSVSRGSPFSPLSFQSAALCVELPGVPFEPAAQALQLGEPALLPVRCLDRGVGEKCALALQWSRPWPRIPRSVHFASPRPTSAVWQTQAPPRATAMPIQAKILPPEKGAARNVLFTLQLPRIAPTDVEQPAPPLRATAFLKRMPRLLRALPAALALAAAMYFYVPLARYWHTIQSAARNRAAIEMEDDFRAGLGAWTGAQEGPNGWSYDQAGFLRVGDLMLWRPSTGLSDYRLEFLGQIEAKSLSWVFRAQDLWNYYAMKIAIAKPGPLPAATIVRFAVIDGEKDRAVESSLPVTVTGDTLYRIEQIVHGSDFLTRVNGQVVDHWSDPRLKRGGMGFVSNTGERARLRWVRLAHQDDLIGKILAKIARADSR